MTVVGVPVEIPTMIAGVTENGFRAELVSANSQSPPVSLGDIMVAKFSADDRVLLTGVVSRRADNEDSLPVFMATVRSVDGKQTAVLTPFDGVSSVWISASGDFLIYKNNYAFMNSKHLWILEARKDGRVVDLGEPDSYAITPDGSRLAVNIPNGNFGNIRTFDLRRRLEGEGSAFHAQICQTSGDALRPFRATDRQEVAGLRGRPWNPCDWRGLMSIEGVAQAWRRFAVLYLGAPDYACDEKVAYGPASDGRRLMCEIGEVDDLGVFQRPSGVPVWFEPSSCEAKYANPVDCESPPVVLKEGGS
jgi:hypothetical protein